MRKQTGEILVQVLTLTVEIAIGITRIAWRITTSDAVKSGIQTSSTYTVAIVTAVVMGGLGLLGRTFPTARKIVRVGIIGGWRYFKGAFNKNGGAMVQSTRNTLSPLEWISTGIAVVVLVFAPFIGAALLISTYIVFFRDVESLPLTTFGADSAGVDSLIGIGTSLIVNLFNLFGAIRSTIRWVTSQFK